MTKLVLLHGLGQTYADWYGVTNNLKQDYMIIDFFTNLDTDSEVTLESIYLEVSKKLDELTEPFYLCGLSLGGLLTLMYITRKRNDSLKGIVVSGAIYKSIPNWLNVFQSFIFKMMPKSKFQSMGLSKKQVINLMKSVNINLETDLAKVELPSLIICGEKDRINMKSSKEINKLIKNSNLQIIDNAGHEINKEQPLKLAEVINSFIN